MIHLLGKLHNPGQLKTVLNSPTPGSSLQTIQFGQRNKFNFDTDLFIRDFRRCPVEDAAHGLVSFICLAKLASTYAANYP